MVFLDKYVDYYIKPHELDEEKARKWFSGENSFIIDVYGLEICSKKDYTRFLELFDFNETIETFIAKLKDEGDIWGTHYKKLLGIFLKKTVFGLSKYCQESEDWEDPVQGDNVYRFEWFHHVISGQSDWGLYAMEHPKKAKQRQMALSIPPQHGKSFIVSGMTPAFFMGNRPKIHGIVMSYNEDMAKLIIDRDFTGCVASVGYSKLFPNLFGCHFNDEMKQLWQSSGRKLPIDTTSTKSTTRGGRIFAGSLSQVTGKRGGFLILDDPIPDYKAAISDAFIETTNSNVETSMNTRMNEKTFLVTVQTRWREKDPIGVAIEKNRRMNEEGFDIKLINICLRAFCETVDDFPYDFRTYKGQMLWESFHKLSYANAKVADNPITFNALYQQRPIDGSGSIFKRENFQRYFEAPTNFSKLIISVDTSYKDLSTSDKCAVGIFGVTASSKYYLLGYTYDRMDFPKTLDTIVNYIREYPNYTEILIEAKSNGQPIITMLENRIPRVITVEATDSKKARAYAVQPIVNSGRVYIPATKEGDEFISQLISFRGEGSREKDDLVDILTQMLTYCDSNFRPQFSIDDIRIESVSSSKMDYSVNSQNYREVFGRYSNSTKLIFNKFSGGNKWL